MYAPHQPLPTAPSRNHEKIVPLGDLAHDEAIMNIIMMSHYCLDLHADRLNGKLQLYALNIKNS